VTASAGNSATRSPDGDRASAAAPAATSESLASFDLFELGRRAAAARDAALGGRRASFARARQLGPGGTWRGPRDAAESYVEAADLPGLGGWAAAAALGVGLLVGDAAAAVDRDAHDQALAAGGRSLLRLSFRAGEPAAARAARLRELRDRIAGGSGPWGLMPTPEGEAEGLDTLRLVAEVRLALPEVPHLLLDVAALGPRLAQMALGFGGDELWGPIVSERALRLGSNARNPAMTRKEAAALIRGADLAARERLGPGPDDYSEEIAP
jgi:hypothetical protein